MKSAPQILHALLGYPPGVRCSDADEFLCRLCGGASLRGIQYGLWGGSVTQNKVRIADSDHVCEACAYICARDSPVPATFKSGRDGQNFRLFSHLVEGSTYRPVTKAHKPEILSFLRSHHRSDWFAAITDSGQKHVIPWTPVNGPGRGGRLLFEEALVVVPSSDDAWRIVDDMKALLTAGATKLSVASGDYAGYSLSRCAELIMRFEAEYARLRHGAWFELALWLAQRDEGEVAERVAAEKSAAEAKKTAAKSAKPKGPNANAKRGIKGKTPHADCRSDSRDARRVSPNAGSQHPQTLGPDARPSAVERADDGKRGRVGDGDGKGAAAGRSQLSLF